MNNRCTWPLLAGLTFFAACADGSQDEGLVARVGDQALTVEQVVDLLVDQEDLPNRREVVVELASLWVDYTLLAQAVARDSSLSDLDLEPLIREQIEQGLVFQLRDSVIQVDTVVSDEELRRRFAQEAPGARLTARHILLPFPAGSGLSQRDSLRAQLEGIRQRAVAGESFAELARRYSQDPATAPAGGDLGSFSRGEMVKPFEDAAFALEPGEISQVVESPYGFHLIQVTDREAPNFEAVRETFRDRTQTERAVRAESTYVAGLEERATPATAESALEVVREVAKDPSARLSGRAARRSLVSFDGGAFTVGELQFFLQGRDRQYRERVAAAPDEQLEELLRGLVQRELLVAEARAVGLEPPRQQVDSLVDGAVNELLQVARNMGLRDLDRAPGEPLEPAIARAVNQALMDVLTGASPVFPLGQVSFQLRRQVPWAVFEDGSGVGQVILEVGRIRSTRGTAPIDSLPGPPDTASSGDPGN
jgi:parvulin-like peptidyl-prolyl isomerase